MLRNGPLSEGGGGGGRKYEVLNLATVKAAGYFCARLVCADQDLLGFFRHPK